MPEGGGDFGYDDPDLDYQLNHDDDDDEQEVDRTQPFHPGGASTPTTAENNMKCKRGSASRQGCLIPLLMRKSPCLVTT